MTDEVEAVAHDVETIILRRLHLSKVAGYALEMSQEIARAAIAALDKAREEAKKPRPPQDPDDGGDRQMYRIRP